jgi:hypothetical protein
MYGGVFFQSTRIFRLTEFQLLAIFSPSTPPIRGKEMEMMTETVATYEFEEDAVGLGNFIVEAFNDKNMIRDDEIVIYVEDGNGNLAKEARLVRSELTDGSTVVNLIIDFHVELFPEQSSAAISH